MSDRNNTLFAIITIGFVLTASVLTAVYVVGQLDFDWASRDYEGLDPNADEYLFTFDETSTSIAPEFTININIDVGGVNVFFVDNSTLVYRLDAIVSNDTYRQKGAPNPTYNSQVLVFSYSVISVNITLGTGTFYKLDITIDVGSIDMDTGEFSQISDVDFDVDVGSIKIALLEDTTFDGNVTVDLVVDVGSIDMVIGLPDTIGGRFTGSIVSGDFDVYSFGWNEITDYRYETSNYASAGQTITINSDLDTGSQFIVLNQ